MSNNMYTHEERSIIIKYIIDNNIDGNLQGNALWKRMEQERVLNRTWQSMRSHFKTTIINMLHLYGLSDYHRKMILHAFGRKTRPHISHSTRSALPKKPVPFSSDSDSDTTVCITAQAKRRKRDSGSSSSIDLLSCNTNNDKRNPHVSATVIDPNQPSTSTSTANCDIRSYIVNTAASDNSKPTTSTPKLKDHKKTQKHSDSVVIIDSDDDEAIKVEVTEQVGNNLENEPFSMEEDTHLIMFFKTHQCYLADIRNNFAYVAFNYDTPSSIRTPKELRTRFVEHIMPNLFTYSCLTYEEMLTYYDRADIDVPVEFQQLISKTVAEQKKQKQITTTKVTVEQRSSEDKMVSADVELITDNTMQGIVQEQPDPPDACPAVNVGGKPTMVDASVQVQPAKGCNTMVDASTQVLPATVDNRTMADASTQTQPTSENKPCNTDVIVQHVEFISDNILHIFLPEQDERRPLQDLQNMYSRSQKNKRPEKYTMLNDKRYVDVAADASVRQIAIDKCEAELLRLTAGVKRLEGTLCKLRGYETTTTVSDNKENQITDSNLVIKNEHCTNVADVSNNTSIVSGTVDTLSDGEATDGNTLDNAGSQTEVVFDTFQTELDKKHRSTQNTTQDDDQDESSTIIEIQPDIEFVAQQLQLPVEVEQTSDESDVPRDSRGCQTEPLNLSTNSHESDSAENVNSDKFYSARSQNVSEN